MRKVLTVPYIDQTYAWPTGCESVSSVMLCQYLGIEITVDTFIKEYLPMESMRFAKTPDTDQSAEISPVDCCREISSDYDSNIGSGPDPNAFFAGNPYDADSFGCYPGVIVKALNSCFSDPSMCRTDGMNGEEVSGLRAADASGWNTEQYKKEIEEGRPVIYWASIDLKKTIPGPRWTLSESAGKRAGQEFTWISNEHCMLLVGYDEEQDTLVFADPWKAHGIVDYDRELVEQRHAEQEKRAVVIRRKEEE